MAAIDAMHPEHRERLRTAAVVHETVKHQVHESISTSLQKETERLLVAMQEDVQTDREIVVAIRELVQALRAPIQRTCTLHLSTGPVAITVHEQRL
jgi:hypothetical protein